MEKYSDLSEEDIKKLNAERELEKIDLEIANLKKKWWKQPAFIVPFVGALSSLILLGINGYFGSRLDRIAVETMLLEDRKHILNDSLKSLNIDLQSMDYRLNLWSDSLNTLLDSITNSTKQFALDSAKLSTRINQLIRMNSIFRDTLLSLENRKTNLETLVRDYEEKTISIDEINLELTDIGKTIEYKCQYDPDYDNKVVTYELLDFSYDREGLDHYSEMSFKFKSDIEKNLQLVVSFGEDTPSFLRNVNSFEEPEFDFRLRVFWLYSYIAEAFQRNREVVMLFSLSKHDFGKSNYGYCDSEPFLRIKVTKNNSNN